MNVRFVAGGTMKPDAPTYIERAADTELYEAVLNSEYCAVLTTRQMGKSSLMARTAVRLRERGIACATVDLQGRGNADVSPNSWYYGFLNEATRGLELDFDFASWWKQNALLPPAQRFIAFLADIVLKRIPLVVVFVDEVDWMIRLPFSDEFFATIRACFNRRATDPDFERLTFVLLGSASPSQLIKDPTRTPFNIGRGIALTDFTAAQVAPLAQWLGDGGDAILARILHWTDGHPYLTQMLCAKVQESGAANVDQVVQEKLLSTAARREENNLKFVADRLTQGTTDLRRVLRTYREILSGKPIRDIPASPVHITLRLSGAVKPDAERILRVRNLVYRTVFDERWAREKAPAQRTGFVAVAAVAVLVVLVSNWFFLIYPRPYLEAMDAASEDIAVVVQAFNKLNVPFHRGNAWKYLARYYERTGDRDGAIMVRAKMGDRAALAHLIGDDYPYLIATYRYLNMAASLTFATNRSIVVRTAKTELPAQIVPVERNGLVALSTPYYSRVTVGPDGAETARLTHFRPSVALAFSPDGSRVAVGCADASVRVFPSSMKTFQTTVFNPPESSPSFLKLTTEPGVLLITDTRNNRRVTVPLRLLGTTLFGIDLTLDGRFLVTAGATWASLYRVSDGSLQHIASRYLPVIHNVRFHPDTCPTCVEVIRNVPGDPAKREIVDFDRYDRPPIEGDLDRIVAEWSRKLAMRIDDNGLVVPVFSKEGELLPIE